MARCDSHVIQCGRNRNDNWTIILIKYLAITSRRNSLGIHDNGVKITGECFMK